MDNFKALVDQGEKRFRAANINPDCTPGTFGSTFPHL
jgi:hypothetical protein